MYCCLLCIALIIFIYKERLPMTDKSDFWQNIGIDCT